MTVPHRPSRCRHGVVATMWVAILCTAFAVDRSKFRTCEQTSFCRRHRDGHSGSLYQYNLDDIKFQVATKEEKKASGSLWKSLQERVLLSGDEGELDPYVKGPSPTLTGVLSNVSPQTCSGQPEKLSWSLYALSNGMVRMRVTELYDSKDPLRKARVTYDDLVLQEQNLQKAHSAELIRSGNADHDALLQKLASGKQLENYEALRYDPGMICLIQKAPFALFVFYEDRIGDGPIVSMAGQDMMHFEVRREKKEEQEAKGEDDKEDAENEETDKKDEDEKPKKKGDKEIVGYWEDGLAIYADGTREEKHEKEAEEEHHRMLSMSQAELDREGLWEESFGSHKDSKPHGPMSVGMDITFSGEHLFGLPEHASSTQLLSTMGEGAHYKEPYRLYNLDVFEYELDETMALYGHVPLIVSHSNRQTAGVFWFNPTETFVDVMKPTGPTTTTHWMSESGIVDIFILPGPTPEKLYHQYGLLTGTSALPPMFALGYHQCRWNYKDEKDVYHVHSKFEEYDYPYDVLWLDIEHTDGKRYFTWDDNLFPNPEKMQQTLKAQGRNMVTIVDPHIKRDKNYYIHKEATSKGLYIKDGDKDYDGWCWPGSSSYLDFTSQHVREWWAKQFSFNTYKGSTPSLFTWNDMNEPSVFNGPEVSMQKDLLNLKGDEHREWHNLYGMLFHRATSEGLMYRNNDDGNTRPFVLSRAFFAGSQQYGSIWTGDNTATWEHLAISSPMLLSLNIAALSFVGADVGGFFQNPNAELFERWMQAGAFQPFFRGHAHHDAKRREPWMFGDETLARLRKSAMARYALLPYWYTVFHHAHTTGMPVMRMMWMQYPQTEALFGVDSQYMIGSDLMVKPITTEGTTQTKVLFPTDDIWYDVITMSKANTKQKSHSVDELTVKAPLEKIPVYQRGGSIIPRKLRLRRSSSLMKTDPYTLYVALGPKKQATGSLYMDDEESFDYQRKQEYGLAHFELSNQVLKNEPEIGSGWQPVNSARALEHMIERIIIMGMDKAPAKLTCEQAGKSVELEFDFDKAAHLVTIRKPGLSALESWEIGW